MSFLLLAKIMGDQVVASGSEVSDVEDEESFFQDVDILQNHGIVCLWCWIIKYKLGQIGRAYGLNRSSL